MALSPTFERQVAVVGRGQFLEALKNQGDKNSRVGLRGETCYSFTPKPTAEPALPTTWQTDLTHRLRALLRTAPVHDLESRKGHFAADFEAHDLRALALRVIDAAIEAMGLGDGIPRRELYEELAPMARAAEPDADDARVRQVVDRVVDGLLNLSDRGAAFRFAYSDFQDADREGEPFARREIAFHLLREVETDEGAIVLRATTEGVNLYTGMLQYDVEDAQRAEEAVLEAQIRRGRLDEAVGTARRARQRSIQYEEKIRSFLKQARRDVRALDWVGEVLRVLGEAREHLEERLQAERELLKRVRDRLDAAETDAPRWAELQRALGDCVTRHLRLQGEVMRANTTWLNEQERQVFRPRVLGPLPDMDRMVLGPALELPVGALAELAGPLLRLFQAPTPPKMLYLPQALDRLLASRRGVGEVALETGERVLEAVAYDERRFSDLDAELVADLLRDVEGARLSELLAAARERGADEVVQQLLVLEVLGPWDQDSGSLRVEATGEMLEDEAFGGDELVVDSRTSIERNA